MKKLIILIAAAFLLLSACVANAADVSLEWDAVVGATGYKLYTSYDLGATWEVPTDVTAVTVIEVTGVPEDKLVLFRVSAYDVDGESIRLEAGAWYDHRLLPLAAPSSTGIQ